jgi:beta-glucosidase
VRNRGRRAGEHTVLLFASKRGASEAFPASRLVAYRKLRLQPGDRRTVSLSFPVDRLAVTAGGDKAVEPGRYELTAGERSTTVEVR